MADRSAGCDDLLRTLTRVALALPWAAVVLAQPAPDAAQIRAQIRSVPPAKVISVPVAPPPSPAAKGRPSPSGEAVIKRLPPELEAASNALLAERIRQQTNPTRSIATPGVGFLKFFSGAAEMPDRDTGEALVLRALTIASEPLRFDTERRRLRGNILLGVVEVGTTARKTLSTPIDFQVIGVSAIPNPIVASRTSPPFETVTIEVADTGESVVNVRVRSNLAPDKEEIVELKVQRPGIVLSVSPEAIQGWGLETAVLTVQAGEPGFGRQALQLTSRIGRLDDNHVLLDDNGMASQIVRSASIGTDTITVRGIPFGEETRQIRYTLPVRFMVAAVLGGLAGGILRIGKKFRLNRSSARELGLAVLAGAVVFGLYALGVNLSSFRLPAQAGEVLVFVVSALGAFVGSRLLTPAPPIA